MKLGKRRPNRRRPPKRTRGNFALATLRELRRRINTSKNISQITHTMELVAAAKMRRAQNAMQASRPYSDAIGRVLAELAERRLEVMHPFLQPREVKIRLLILVTT